MDANYEMSKAIKSKIYELLDNIHDDKLLNQVMEDIAFYASKVDITDELSAAQKKELDDAILEADKHETIDWSDFKKEMNEWKKGSHHQEVP